MDDNKLKISIDTRTIKKGEYFVPIKGKNFDGNYFIEDALKKGAKGVLNEEDLYKLASKKLNKVKPTILAVSGSIGKTTFRTYFCSILSTKFKVLDGDKNTKLGLALKIVNELTDQQIFVAEIGIDRLGEMKVTTDFVKPDFSVITKLGKEHQEFLKSFSNVIKENSIVVTNSKRRLGYLNYEDKEHYSDIPFTDCTIKWFPDNDIDLSVVNKVEELLLPTHDKVYLKAIYQVLNDNFDFSSDDFIKALSNIIKPKGRLNVLSGINNCIVIDDTYNAVCDQTVIAGLKFAREIASKEKKNLHIVLSNMRETGTTTEEQHKNVAEFLNSFEFNSLTLVGDQINWYKKYLKKDYVSFNNALEIQVTPTKDDLYYIKATRFYKGADLVSKLVS